MRSFQSCARVRAQFCVVLTFCTLTFSSGAFAEPSWLGDFNSRYGTNGTRLDTCGVCHMNFGSGSRNPYANAFRDAGGPDNPSAGFAAIEGAFSDSDNTNNLDEITARFMPGISCDNIGATSNAPADLADYVDPQLPGCMAVDTDGDSVPDNMDNCTLVANVNQVDTDGDGIGNQCDGDFTQDCMIDFLDLGQMKAVFFQNNPPNGADMTGDGPVDFLDLGRLKSVFFTTPGPSGLPNACAR